MDWTLDWIMNSRFGLEFWLPGVKNHMHVNQQQSFVYNHSLAIEYTTKVYSLSIPWLEYEISIYLSIYIYTYSCYEVVISLAGSTATIRVLRACPLPILKLCSSCVPDQYSHPFNNIWCCHTLCSRTFTALIMLINPQALICFWESTWTMISYCLKINGANLPLILRQ